MRLFFGIFAPSELIQAVLKINPLLTQLSGKQVELENLHLTLIFLGNVDKEHTGKLCQIGDNLAKEILPFNIMFGAVETLPRVGPARMLNINVENANKFSDLQSRLADELSKEKIVFEKYHKPHLTLIRLKDVLTSSLPKLKQVAAAVVEFSLIESQLTSSGPIYKIIKSFKLGGEKNKAYRSSIAICLFNEDGEVLLIKNSIFPGEHWQIPQGGIEEGESPQKAAMRELAEETQITDVQLISLSKNKYSHLYKNNTPENIYIGQEFTTAFIRAQGRPKIKLDKTEASDYKWTEIKDVINTVANSRKEYMNIVIEELNSLINKNYD